MASTTTTRNARNARMAGGAAAKANATTGTKAKPKRHTAKAVTTRVDPSIVRGKGKAAQAKATKARKASTAKATQATTARKRPGDHGLVPLATGKLTKATVGELLAAKKGDKATGLVYRSMRCQHGMGAVATVDNRKGLHKAPKGWLAVDLANGAYGHYSGRHAAATAMAFPAAHGGTTKAQA